MQQIYALCKYATTDPIMLDCSGLLEGMIEQLFFACSNTSFNAG
jgi:hypothetical protein